MDGVRRLPRGRHALSPEAVAEAQRDRLMTAMAQVMSEKGYVKTSVEDVIRRAVISRQSFYRHFTSKQDCFMAAFRRSTQVLEQRIATAASGDGGPVERFERALADFLEALVLDPASARLCVSEVYAAGPEAVAHRTDFQRRLGERMAAMLEAGTEAGQFACQVLVAAIATMVAGPLATGEQEALRALGPPLVEHVRGLKAAGLI
ncbi:TetR/AcrR family transcriptional regulator [Nonomuraea endophytica]|uniref:AcrR family transcriptional regulator n=1 Tax=Nonomuraea endophytica TaxID=714136 RepID=A0A7W8AF86_9ACTN|nr:TetR/AcrR family transcriptional regulator [Nonomuraea endophytica]MBB5084050.1 AcrR family transcriptional regulator [Nonomuraea endophytica]